MFGRWISIILFGVFIFWPSHHGWSQTDNSKGTSVTQKNLLTNGNFEEGDSQPAGWGRSPSASYIRENGNRYLLFRKPGQIRRELVVSPKWQELEVTCRMRAKGLRLGTKPWHDARLVME
ncbi:MAG: hypothetical protein D6820_01985, partial [Lentisphaerae bacterium]